MATLQIKPRLPVRGLTCAALSIILGVTVTRLEIGTDSALSIESDTAPSAAKLTALRALLSQWE